VRHATALFDRHDLTKRRRRRDGDLNRWTDGPTLLYIDTLADEAATGLNQED